MCQSWASARMDNFFVFSHTASIDVLRFQITNWSYVPGLGGSGECPVIKSPPLQDKNRLSFYLHLRPKRRFFARTQFGLSMAACSLEQLWLCSAETCFEVVLLLILICYWNLYLSWKKSHVMSSIYLLSKFRFLELWLAQNLEITEEVSLIRDRDVTTT